MLLFLLLPFLITRQKEDMLLPGRKQLNTRGEKRRLANMPQLRRHLLLHLSTTPVTTTDISQATLGINLGQKPKLGGVRISHRSYIHVHTLLWLSVLILFHCIIHASLISFSSFLLVCLINLKKNQKK